MATVVIGVAAYRERMAAMHLPRTVVTPHLMGRPMGAPHDRARQTEVLLAALDLLDRAEQGNTVVELPGSYRPAPA
jgi:hypothetical protein